MALCAWHKTSLLQQQQQRPLPCTTCSSGVGPCAGPSSGPVGLCSSSGRSSCSGAFTQQAPLGRRNIYSHRQRQRQAVTCSAGGNSSGDSASRVLAWAMDAARRTFRLKGADSEDPQQSDDPQQPQQQQTQAQQQQAGSAVGEASLAIQPSSMQQNSRRNSGSSAHDVADDHNQESFESWKEVRCPNFYLSSLTCLASASQVQLSIFLSQMAPLPRRTCPLCHGH